MVRISADSAQRRGFEASVFPRGHSKLLGVGVLHGGVVVRDEVLLVLGRVQKCNIIFLDIFLKRNMGYGNGGSPRGNQASARMVRIGIGGLSSNLFLGRVIWLLFKITASQARFKLDDPLILYHS